MTFLLWNGFFIEKANIEDIFGKELRRVTDQQYSCWELKPTGHKFK